MATTQASVANSNITVYTLASVPPHISKQEDVQEVARTTLSFKA